MDKPHITRRIDGEYSTVRMGDMIETMWFGDDGTERVVARSLASLAHFANKHIALDEA